MKIKSKKLLDLIKDGELVIVPTDTVYGLVCKYNSKSAVEKIYELKKRDRKKPLILLGHSWRILKKFVKSKDSPSCWPGAVTLILPASSKTPKYLNKGYKTIGIRVPKNKFLLKLLKKCPGGVLASTSANLSGKSDKKPQKELEKKVKLFIKAKKGEMSLKPSKIIEIKNGNVKRLR